MNLWHFRKAIKFSAFKVVKDQRKYKLIIIAALILT